MNTKFIKIGNDVYVNITHIVFAYKDCISDMWRVRTIDTGGFGTEHKVERAYEDNLIKILDL